MKTILFFLLGYWFGAFAPSHLYQLEIAIKKLRLGICFRYEGKGYREIINGTNSEFCLKCNHPAGYHWHDKNLN